MTSDPDNYGFDYQPLDADNVADAGRSLFKGDLFGIVSETDGGIIAYAIGEDHAHAIVRTLLAAEGEYEADMVATVTNTSDAAQGKAT